MVCAAGTGQARHLAAARPRYGVPRATKDLDINLFVRAEDAEAALNLLRDVEIDIDVPDLLLRRFLSWRETFRLWLMADGLWPDTRLDHKPYATSLGCGSAALWRSRAVCNVVMQKVTSKRS